MKVKNQIIVADPCSAPTKGAGSKNKHKTFYRTVVKNAKSGTWDEGADFDFKKSTRNRSTLPLTAIWSVERSIFAGEGVKKLKWVRAGKIDVDGGTLALVASEPGAKSACKRKTATSVDDGTYPIYTAKKAGKVVGVKIKL